MTGTDPRFELRAGMDRLRGQLFEFMESLDMPARQEKAVKGVIRTLTYSMQATLEGTLNER